MKHLTLCELKRLLNLRMYSNIIYTGIHIFFDGIHIIFKRTFLMHGASSACMPQVPACLKCLHARTHITTPKQPVRFLHDSGFDSDLDGVHLERLRKNTVFVGRST